jgi:hypothetical protein
MGVGTATRAAPPAKAEAATAEAVAGDDSRVFAANPTGGRVATHGPFADARTSFEGAGIAHTGRECAGFGSSTRATRLLDVYVGNVPD